MTTNKKKGYLLIAIAAVIFFNACGPTHTFTHMTYLADSVTNEQKIVQAYKPVVLGVGDRVSIKVNALDPAVAQVFNGGVSGGDAAAALSANGGSAGTGATASAGVGASSPSTYLIDEKGEIRFPQLGAVKVLGLTASSLADTIQNKLAMLIKEPVVTVEIVNFQVNVLGEVNRPGTILVPNGKITILEAISQCGDLSINGLRDNVLVVRETDGKRQYGRVSLASNNIFLSPFYYLKQGDIVYVEMNRNKLLGSDQAHARRINYAALALTAVTAAAILYSVLKK